MPSSFLPLSITDCCAPAPLAWSSVPGAYPALPATGHLHVLLLLPGVVSSLPHLKLPPFHSPDLIPCEAALPTSSFSFGALTTVCSQAPHQKFPEDQRCPFCSPLHPSYWVKGQVVRYVVSAQQLLLTNEYMLTMGCHFSSCEKQDSKGRGSQGRGTVPGLLPNSGLVLQSRLESHPNQLVFQTHSLQRSSEIVTPIGSDPASQVSGDSNKLAHQKNVFSRALYWRKERESTQLLSLLAKTLINICSSLETSMNASRKKSTINCT